MLFIVGAVKVYIILINDRLLFYLVSGIAFIYCGIEYNNSFFIVPDIIPYGTMANLRSVTT